MPHMNDSSRPPWEVSPALRPERLQMIAVAARNARDAAIAARDPRDDDWCTGCRAYTWTRGSITALQKGAASEWLRAQESGLAFTFIIQDVSMKFYRGAAGQPTLNTLRSGVREMLAQGRLHFLDDEISRETEGWFWLMAIDTDLEGQTLEVVVLQANKRGETRFQWSVPLDGRAVSISDISDVRREGVDQEPAEPGIPGDEAKAVGDDEEDEDNQ